MAKDNSTSTSTCTLPFVPIPDQLQRGGYGYLRYEITTPHGCFDVEIRYGFLYCRGPQQVVVAYGLVKPEWLPGLPGNGFTSNSVVFDVTGPRVVVGKLRGLKFLPHIHVQAWGYIRRTVVVRVPMTEEQIRQVEAFEQQDNKEDIEPISPPVKSQHRTEGNVVYLFRQGACDG